MYGASDDMYVKDEGLIRKEQFKEPTEGAAILFANRKIVIIPIIDNLLLYGFLVIMPLCLCTTRNGGIDIFKTKEWMRIWGFVSIATLILSIFWGWFMDRFGWVRPVPVSVARCLPSAPSAVESAKAMKSHKRARRTASRRRSRLRLACRRSRRCRIARISMPRR